MAGARPYKVAVRDDKPRSVLGLVFLTVFLDIVGFSVLFPIFPALLEHYLAVEGEASALGRLTAFLRGLVGNGGSDGKGDDSLAVATLFGGILGSLYGGLQFVFSVVWGGLSDRIGRRPTLLVTLTGTAAAYVLWTFAGSFGVLVLSRVVAGIMAGNISTASAAVADSTTGSKRAAGMGIVGMAIGLGFVFGPALGALTAGWKLDGATSGAVFALNPFSGCALASLAIALCNLVWVATRFPETLAPKSRGAGAELRTLHPFARLGTLGFPGVKRANVVYLCYYAVFSAMEFTLVFLAAERFGFGARENAAMFVFVGVVIALVQGGVVRRLAPKRGEKNLAVTGLALTVPGIAAIGFAGSLTVFYLGLFLMAVGSALASPCLSSLVSRYTPADRQGLSQGVLRSMGSLARAAGPILGGLAYWSLGSAAPYYIGAACLLVPLGLARALPPVPAAEGAATVPSHTN